MTEQKLRDYLNRVTIDLQRTRRQLAQAEAAGHEPIAVVSMSCRFPGGVRSPEQLWELVAQGRDATSEVPQDRGWDLGALTASQVSVRGAFIDGIADFDAGFFAVSPHEATAMDPQQRLLLTTAWEAVERGGIDPASLRGSATGVFAAAVDQGFAQVALHASEAVRNFIVTGNSMSVLAGRVSYALGLEGPALTVDTACSSSLVALHLAAQALRRRECALALAAGVTVMSLPLVYAEFGRQGAMSADGRCKAFSATADGTGWGEGAGVVLLERLSDARRNGHPVLAVIRGSAVNQDGASNGLTAPNGPSQERLLRAALADAGLTAADVDAVEAHGTGTTLGDPIEADALLAAYGRQRPADRPLWVGSLKSNIGHTQAAAGIAGVIKTVLALGHAVLPRSLHITEPTPHVDWSAGAVRLLTENRAWPDSGRPRRAGVSAFGMSGTNAHVILEQAPAVEAESEPVRESAPGPGSVAPCVLAGRTPAALRDQAARLAGVLSAGPATRLVADPAVGLAAGRVAEPAADLAAEPAAELAAGPAAEPAALTALDDLADLGFSLAATRTAFEHRAVVLAEHRAELLAGLGALAADRAQEPDLPVVVGTAEPGPGRTVFVFPGQGAQWAGMARELIAASPVFAASVAECERAMAAEVDWSLTGVLCGAPDAPSLDRVDVVQPALFAMMVSLAALWRSWGVEPDAVVGHSQGEIAAAVVAGGLSLADGAKIVARRSRAIGALAGRGGMVALALGEQNAQDLVAPWAGRVSVAAVNGPAAVVVSGAPDALGELVARCEERGVRATRVPVDYASHSAQVEAIRTDLLAVLAGVCPRTGEVPLFSTLTGDWLDTADMNAEYWYRNLRGTVRFESAIRDLARQGFGVFVEVSPHPVLTVPVQDTLESADLPAAVVTGTLRRDEGGLRRALTGAAELWVRGVAVDWTVAFPGARPVGLPTYPFQERRFWPEPKQATPSTGAERSVEHEPDPADALRYRITWRRLADPPAAVLSGRWLLVLPVGHSASAHTRWAAQALRDLGAEVEQLELADSDADREQLAVRLKTLRLTDTSAESTGTAPSGIISLLALADRPHPRYPALPAGLALTVALIQALADAGCPAPLWCATTGAVTIGSAEPLTAPGQAMVWGTGMVAALELPERWGGLLDLPDEPDARATLRLGAALSGAGEVSGEDQLALRASGLYARRLVRAPRTANPQARPWRPRGTVLLTGGTGAVGGHLARWLARGGAEHLVLPGRRGADTPTAQRLRAEVGAHGARLSTPVCDLADRAQVERLLADLDGQGTPVTAVVHAAAFIALAPLADCPLEAFADVVAAKAGGAAHLDALLDRDLDAFVLVSSIAGLWGSGDHGAYAAGNAYLHALARHRRDRGLTATTVDWGVWRTGTPGDDPGDLFKLDEHGLRRMAPEAALAALQQVLDDDETVVAVADVDWERFAPVFASSRPSPLLRTVPEAYAALNGGAEGPSDPTAAKLRERLARISAPERSRALLDLVRAQAAAVLGHDSPRQVPPGKAFQELGFASLTAVELRNRLAAATGLRLPSSLVFDHPSAAALARHLEAELFGAGAGAGAAGPGTVASAVTPSGAGTAAADAAEAGEPIAIVAMGCRLPGGIDTPEKLWRLLAEGGETITGLPADRGWPGEEELYDPDPDHPGTATTRSGGFLHDAAAFDAEFFGISPREALAMDPQQRLLLETSWEAMERAGMDPEALRGSRTGVYIGVNYSDYGSAVARSDQGEGHLLTGSAPSIVSGRVAYTFGLEGPALTIDTACSSSLVALHTAVRALRAGDCSLALVGGVAVMATPGAIVSFSRQRGLAADGRCKAFAEAADGMGMGEGVGVLIVERLGDARRNGHPVLAVLRGSAVNSDGASNGLAAPNGPAQQRVIRSALADARLTAADVDVVEAHGTGTTLGDPIEAQALLAAYGQDRPAEHPLLIGSLKSNIGHTQAASGVAGVMKTVLALRHAQIPPTLHIDRPSSHVDWDSGAVRPVTGLTPWPRTGRVRRAGVSSFGLSGTNAHVILEQAPQAPQPQPQPQQDPDAESAAETEAGPHDPARDAAHGPLPWVLSARTPAALADQATRLSEHLDGADAVDPVAVGLALAGRTAFAHRRVLVADPGELPAALRAVAAGLDTPAEVRGVQDTEGRTVFVFPGQGSQWAGMARELLAASPVFAARMAECDAALSAHVDWSLLEVLRSAAPLDRVDLVQPALFAVMVSLAALWRSHGVEPDAVIGHSQGEIAAAVVAGGLSLADGARVVASRSRALAELAGSGAMVSVALPLSGVRRLLEPWGERLSVAAVNGPSAVVVSGAAEAAAELLAGCEADGVRARRIEVDYASHSAQMEPMRSRLLDVLAPIAPVSGQVPLFSTLTGDWLDTHAMDAAYWYENLRRTVGFEAAVRAVADQGFTTFIEISPHPVLTVPIEQTLQDAGRDGTVLGTLRRDEADLRRMLISLGQAWACGRPVDWSALFHGAGARRADLPTYPFQHRRYWALPVPGTGGEDVAAAGLDAAGHPLLGATAEIADTGEILLSGRLSVRTHPWLADHAVSGVILLPGAAFVELALRAAAEAGCAVLEELTLQAPLVLPADGAVRIQVRVGPPDGTGDRPLTVHSRVENGLEPHWTRHATGTVALSSTPPPAETESWPPQGATPIPVEDLYERFAGSGYRYGPVFRTVRAAWRRGEEIFTEVRLPDRDDLAAPAYGVHPALLDAVLHGIWLAEGAAAPEPGTARVPFSWSRVVLHAVGATGLRVRLRFPEDGEVTIHAVGADGRPVLSVGALAVRPIRTDTLTAAAAPDALFRVDWTPLRDLDVPLPPVGRWAAIGPAGLLPDSYADLAGLDAAVEQGAAIPDVVLLACRCEGGDAAGVRKATAAALRLVQQWLGDDRYADSRLVFVTSGAVETRAGEGVADLAGAAVCGLVRSAQSEYPDRFVLVDAADPVELLALLPAGLAAGEPQLAVRAGALLAPRLARVPAAAQTTAGPRSPEPFDASGTVLITGAGGVLAGLTARHLVREHGVRHLLLVGRRGPDTPQAAALTADLAALGARAGFVACDVADRDGLAAALDTIPAEHPLTAVVHTAGALDDGTVPAMTEERLDTVLRPKVDGALNLHELTRDRPLSAFLLYSSAAGVIGNAGQANYAAANAFLDALAAARQAQGLPARSIAWGLWDSRSTMTGALAEAGRQRMTRGGVAALSDAEGLALFDEVLRQDAALLVPVRLDLGRSRPARAAEVPALMRGLIRGVVRPSAAADGAAEADGRGRLAEAGPQERRQLLEDLVRGKVARVLRHPDAESVDPELAFKDLGFDSLTAVELRNQLTAATGIRLPATLVFDHPTPQAVAGYLAERLAPATGPEADVPTRRAGGAGGAVELDAVDRADAANDANAADDADESDSLEDMDVDALVRMALGDRSA